MINDIGGGMLDEDMFATVADLQVAYVLMHMRGTPATMQQQTRYGNVTEEVIRFLAERLHRLYELGVHDVLVDPGFGFAKTLGRITGCCATCLISPCWRLRCWWGFRASGWFTSCWTQTRNMH